MFVFWKHTIDVLFVNGLYDFKYSKGYIAQNKQMLSDMYENKIYNFNGQILYC